MVKRSRHRNKLPPPPRRVVSHAGSEGLMANLLSVFLCVVYCTEKFQGTQPNTHLVRRLKFPVS